MAQNASLTCRLETDIFITSYTLLSALQRFHGLWVCQLPSWAGTVWFVFNARTASFNNLFCFFFCICNFMGTDSGTNTQRRPRGHIVLISTTTTSWSFISPQPVTFLFPNWLRKPQPSLLPLVCGLVVSVNLLRSSRAVSFALLGSGSDAEGWCKCIATLKPENCRLDGRYYWKSSQGECAKSIQQKTSWQNPMNEVPVWTRRCEGSSHETHDTNFVVCSPGFRIVKKSNSLSSIIQSSFTLFWIPRGPISQKDIMRPAWGHRYQ